MKSIAIWINNCLSYNYFLNKIFIENKYSNAYKNEIYNHYLNYFINYYKHYFYDYFSKKNNMTDKEIINHLSDENLQKRIFDLSINKTHEMINNINDDNFKDYLKNNEYYQNEINNNKECYDNSKTMINESISLFKKYNKDTKTVFIGYGTEFSVNADEIIYNVFLDINKFEFTKYFIYETTNSYEYELFCFLRWFIIKDYINSLNDEYDRIYIFDNDTLIFDNLNNYNFNINDKPYMSQCGCPAFTIINKKLLNELCNTLLDIFKNKDKECLTFSKTNTGVISDMGVFYYLYSEHKIEAVNEYKFNPYFIINIGTFVSNNILPKYDIIDNKLYINDNIYDNNYDKVNCLGIHFAGDNKKFIKTFYEQLINL